MWPNVNGINNCNCMQMYPQGAMAANCQGFGNIPQQTQFVQPSSYQNQGYSNLRYQNGGYQNPGYQCSAYPSNSVFSGYSYPRTSGGIYDYPNVGAFMSPTNILYPFVSDLFNGIAKYSSPFYSQPISASLSSIANNPYNSPYSSNPLDCLGGLQYYTNGISSNGTSTGATTSSIADYLINTKNVSPVGTSLAPLDTTTLKKTSTSSSKKTSTKKTTSSKTTSAGIKTASGDSSALSKADTGDGQSSIASLIAKYQKYLYA